MNAKLETVRIASNFPKTRLLETARKSPSLFLAYACMRRSLRTQYTLRRGLPSTVVVVIVASDAGDIYKKATELLLNGWRDAWARGPGRKHALVRNLASPDRMKIQQKQVLEEYDRYDVIVILVRTRSDIPDQLALTADAVVEISPTTPRQIHALRRLLGRQPFDDATLEMLTELDLPILVAFVLKGRFSHVDALNLLKLYKNNGASQAPRLEDLPGFTEVKAWANSFIDDLGRFRKGKLCWSEMARGVLLHGPPGTGKTLFARALATSAGLPLISTSVSEWQSAGHLGNLLTAMRGTFELARSTQPSIVFIDELDSIGDRRTFTGDYVQYSRQVVNQLLECIDGAHGRDHILVVGATNFPDAIDPALLRSGRIERHMRIALPDVEERAAILGYHMGMSAAAKELRAIAVHLDGCSAADLEMLAREARSRGRRNNRAVRLVDLVESLPPLRQLSEADARRVATHEAGHAVVGLSLSPSCRISITLRRSFRLLESNNFAWGLTTYEHDEENLLPTRQDCEDLICRKLAGAAAEEIFTGGASIGFGGCSGSDLDTASEMAARMVCSYGMGESLRFLIESHRVDFRRASRLPDDIRDEIARILDEQYARARSILVKNVSLLDELIGQLLEKQQLSASEVALIASTAIRSTDLTGGALVASFHVS